MEEIQIFKNTVRETQGAYTKKDKTTITAYLNMQEDLVVGRNSVHHTNQTES
jgi:hypothetical protein